MVDFMKLKYDNKEIKLIECKSFFSRLKGFMFKRNINYALLFDKCNSIHTFFMKEKIDVIMLDKDNVIRYYYKNLDKNKIVWPKHNACKTIELPVNYFKIKLNTLVEMENENDTK